MSIYCGCICASSINGIRDRNLQLKKKYQNSNIDNSDFTDYAIESFGGFMIGGFTGIW